MTEHLNRIRQWRHLGATMMIAVMLSVFPIPIALSCATNVEAAEPEERVFDIHIADGKVAADSRTVRVRDGDTVRLRLNADSRVTLHLHGYDIETTLEPGQTAEMVFEAHATGRFPVEVHGGGGSQGSGNGHGVLIFVEVYPR